MSDQPSPAPSLAEVDQLGGPGYPNEFPYTHITFACVAWNEEVRLLPLLVRAWPFFKHIAVAVQESTDGTLRIARTFANVVVEDAHRGYGDATFGPLLLPKVQTPWVLKVDADEMPSVELLQSLSSATWAAERRFTRGVWIPFRSSVEGIEYEEQHAHLRLFKTEAGWPSTLHSRPPIENGILWGTGHIRHDRSLSELVVDYLRYCQIGRGNPGWDDHNRMMIRSACTGTAAVKGWSHVKAHDWWPEALDVAFGGNDPEKEAP